MSNENVKIRGQEKFGDKRVCLCASACVCMSVWQTRVLGLAILIVSDAN